MAVFLLFLLVLERLKRMVVRQADRAQWTAADYSVMITGLQKG